LAAQLVEQGGILYAFKCGSQRVTMVGKGGQSTEALGLSRAAEDTIFVSRFAMEQKASVKRHMRQAGECAKFRNSNLIVGGKAVAQQMIGALFECKIDKCAVECAAKGDPVVFVADEPLLAVARGTGRALEEIDLLQELFDNE